MNEGPQKQPSGSRWSFRLGLVMLTVLAAWFVWTMLSDPLLPIGSKAPTFELPLTDGSGNTLSLADLEGRVVVLDFWSTTCRPCLLEMEDLKVLWRRMKPRGVTVVGLSTGGESLAQIARFGKDRGVDYPLVIDQGQVAASYRVRSLPTLYVLDKTGRIAEAHSGYW
ncbi:MAG: TlpA family protein disulfide reductase, partial [Deltaproteobacteria bacterium]|nr:TlpA family protein disulfide reductase [Deltaproteobacteria bacterium]